MRRGEVVKIPPGIHLHDAEIVAVEMDRDRQRVTIRFCEAEGCLRSLAFHGVQAFRGEDLALQNVVHYGSFRTAALKVAS